MDKVLPEHGYDEHSRHAMICTSSTDATVWVRNSWGNVNKDIEVKIHDEHIIKCIKLFIENLKW